MKQAIVTILSQEDAKFVPNAIAELKRVKCKNTLVFINPSAAMDVEEFARDVDRQIQDLQAAESAASARRDYAGAQNFANQIEAAKTNRVNMISDGIKNVPRDKLVAAINAIADKFAVVGGYVKQDAPQEDVMNFAPYLETLPKKFPFLTPGVFSIITPQGCEAEEEVPAPQKAPQPVSQPPKAVTAPKVTEAPLDPREARKKELSTQYMKMVKVAKQHNIEVQKGKAGDAIEMILAKEFPAAA